VQESLTFSAELRLPTSMPRQAKGERVRQVLEELNLTTVKDSLIGDKLKRGVSGGERKRVSIGKELCYQPKLLLLDEPTSGLDSFTSIKVMTLLRRLAERGRTLACTIHQVRASRSPASKHASDPRKTP
jgi:ATP-binding cassette, subfamily G (WHITE), member 2